MALKKTKLTTKTGVLDESNIRQMVDTLRKQTPPTSYYGILIPTIKVINYKKYKNIGRPRKEDYKILNTRKTLLKMASKKSIFTK